MNSKKILTILTVGALSFTVKAGESQTAEAKDSLLKKFGSLIGAELLLITVLFKSRLTNNIIILS